MLEVAGSCAASSRDFSFARHGKPSNIAGISRRTHVSTSDRRVKRWVHDRRAKSFSERGVSGSGVLAGVTSESEAFITQ